jgi:hypothetical protein
MKKLFLILTACLMMGCVEEGVIYSDPASQPTLVGVPSYGCAVVEDSYGEREVCDVYYYTTPEGVIYWDQYFNVWMGAGGYMRGGIWYHGFLPGYWGHYGVWYHPHGWFGVHVYHGYYGYHWGGFHGGYHGGYHGGWHGGGHGGHR